MPSCFSWFSWTPDSTGPCTSYWANSPSWTWCWFSLLCPKWLLTIWLGGSLSPPLAVGSRSSSSSLLEGVSATLDSYALWSQCPCLSWKLCLSMIWGSLYLSAADGLVQAAATLNFSFCSVREIDHFVCEAPPLCVWLVCDFCLWVCHVHVLCVNAPEPHFSHLDFLKSYPCCCSPDMF